MKKGFTLIELLAVIVILAIIALIATPIVLNIIKDTKESASIRSAENYLSAVEQGIANSELNGSKVNNGTYTIMDKGNLCFGTVTNNNCTGQVLEVAVSGTTPNVGGKLTIEKGKVISVSGFYVGSNMFLMDNNKLSIFNIKSFSTLGKNMSGNSCVTSGTCSQEAIDNGLEVMVKVTDTAMEKFYVINDTGTQVELLLDHNVPTDRDLLRPSYTYFSLANLEEYFGQSCGDCC